MHAGSEGQGRLLVNIVLLSLNKGSPPGAAMQAQKHAATLQTRLQSRNSETWPIKDCLHCLFEA